MRADRLLAMMMMLQANGTLTAQAMAETLEVSERTIYRDIEALGMAGVPVYAERGPGGGISLLEEYRTNLTGLSGDEVRALFMLSIPTPLQQLGVGRELHAALLKLSAALPESGRAAQQAARQRIYLDASWWGQSGLAGPHLGAVQQAVWQDRLLRITTRTFFGASIEQVVAPLGLVAKAADWHLVAQLSGGKRVFRIAELAGAAVLSEKFDRPGHFDLAAFWEAYCRQLEAGSGLFRARARVSPGLLRELPWRLGEGAARVIAGASLPDEQGWRVVEIISDSIEQSRDLILSFGGGAEILEPLALRRSVEDYARQICLVYQNGELK